MGLDNVQMVRHASQICFQGEREPPYSFPTCGPFVSHLHENFPEEAGLYVIMSHSPNYPEFLPE